MPPPVAVTVTFEVPVSAVLLTVNVRVELPLPGAAIGLGLKLALTPEGNPEAGRDTAELKPPLTVVEMVVVPGLPCRTHTLGGGAVTLQLCDAARLMGRATAVG